MDPTMRRARDLLGAATPRRTVLPGRGVEIALLDFRGTGPLALAHHANGFCKGMWAEVAHALGGRLRLVAMDARGHGDSSRPEGPSAFTWSEFANDLAAVASLLAAESGGPLALGIGHSLGATSLLGAAAQRPDCFERLLLIEPVTPPPPAARLGALPAAPAAGPERRAHVAAMADGARRRRSEWPSRLEARRWFAERPMFSTWTSLALDLYVLDGLRERGDGSVELKCPGAVEAAVFEQGQSLDLRAWTTGLETPALWLWAERSNFPLAVYETLAASMPRARVERVAAGHLVPMERPDRVAEAALGTFFE